MGAPGTGRTVPLRSQRRGRQDPQNAGAAAFAATVAPQGAVDGGTRRVEPAPTRRRPWLRTVLPLALATVAAGAGFAAATRHSNHQASSPNSPVGTSLAAMQPPVATQPATTQPATTPPTTSPASAALASLPADTTGPSPATDRASLAKQRPEAKRQAQRYASAATQAAALAAGQPASLALTALVDALRAVSRGYTAAAKAAAAGDLTAYAVATAEINRSKDLTRQAIAQLTAQSQSAGSGVTTPQNGYSGDPTQSPSDGSGGASTDQSGSNGVGDSQSDDPSDDQPNN
jgi:hypothetical protein